MKRISLYDWVQLITGFAIVIGIVLVLVEQYQARIIAEVQLSKLEPSRTALRIPSGIDTR